VHLSHECSSLRHPIRRIFGVGFAWAATAAIVLALSAFPALAQEEIDAETPTPSTVEQATTPIQQTFTPPKQPQKALFPGLRQQLQDTPAFLRDAKMDVGVRSFYYDQDNQNGSQAKAWALGSAISFQSGWIEDTLQAGGVFYTSQKLYGPNDKDGSLLLEPQQRGYSVLGQVYGRVKFLDTNFLNLGRYEYDTPFIGRNDVRMTPNTFEGYTMTGTASVPGDWSFRYGAGYIDKIKNRNSDEFVDMAKSAGASVERGVSVAGGLATHGNFSIGAVDYYSSDIINIGYAETKFTAVDLGGGFQGLLAGQYINQTSTGDNLLTGSEFSTDLWGLKGEIGIAGAILSLGYTITGTGATVLNPWSGAPNYTSSMIQNFNRAGEQAGVAKLSYDLTRIGLDNVTTYVLFAHGETDATTAGTTRIRESEVDLDAEWRPQWEAVKGLSLRARYGYVDVDQGPGSGIIRNLRVIMNYNVAAF
jgi:outer membrane porin, OprD family